MSQIRGIFPLFLATAIGIGNGMWHKTVVIGRGLTKSAGIWVFGPAFKEQQQEKEEQAQ
jgi:hypothetical protein